MQFNINVKAPFFLTQAALPHMPEHGSGRIVLLTSVSARMGVPTQTVYAATKASLESAARVWAHEVRLSSFSGAPSLRSARGRESRVSRAS